MNFISNRSGIGITIALLAASAAGGAYAQDTPQTNPDPTIVVTGTNPAPVTMTAGPEIKGVITARKADKIKVTAADGTATIIAVNDTTRVKAASGLFGSNKKLDATALLNGMPVTVKTMQPSDGSELVASQVSFRNSDFKTASMIRSATDQRFDEQTAATAALRGRIGDIDKYNVKATTVVHFDVGRADLSASDKATLCSTAASANATENSLLLVVGYTDSTGSDDTNQALSEKRAAKVINYLQQQCGWKPYRMLTPTGMAKADPAAPNDTNEGKAQNRRVAVNVLVSKSVDGINDDLK